MGKSGGKRRKGNNKDSQAKKPMSTTSDEGDDKDDEMLENDLLAPLRALRLSMEKRTSPRLEAYFARMKEKEAKKASERTEDPLRDFTKPKRDDCPLCLIELPWDVAKQKYLPCCGISICAACFLQKAMVFYKTEAEGCKPGSFDRLSQHSTTNLNVI